MRLTQAFFQTYPKPLLFLILGLFGISVLMGLSQSLVIPGQARSHFYHLSLGLLCLLVVPHVSHKRISVFAPLCLMILCAISLYLIVTDTQINGSARWLVFGSFSLQPSELMKPFVLLCSARLLSSSVTGTYLRGVFVFHLLALVVCLLILFQPDIGQFILVSLALFSQFFVTLPMDFRRLFQILLASGAFILLSFFVVLHNYQHFTDRLFQFVKSDIGAIGGHPGMAFQALEHGGWFGTGLGQGFFKFRVPVYASNDYAFAVLSEELGILFAGFTLALYGCLCWILFRKAALCRDSYYRSLLVGSASLIAGQVLIHTASVLLLIPHKGTTLPLLSFGGSSIVGISLVLGLVLSIYQKLHAEEEALGFVPQAAFSRGRPLEPIQTR